MMAESAARNKESRRPICRQKLPLLCGIGLARPVHTAHAGGIDPKSTRADRKTSTENMADTAAAASSFPLSPEAFGRLGVCPEAVDPGVIPGDAGGGADRRRDVGPEPTYAVLFSIQDEKDGGHVVTALQQQNVPYRFSPSGHTILVPQTRGP
jgi:hypothetical protein